MFTTNKYLAGDRRGASPSWANEIPKANETAFQADIIQFGNFGPLEVAQVLTEIRPNLHQIGKSCVREAS